MDRIGLLYLPNLAIYADRSEKSRRRISSPNRRAASIRWMALTAYVCRDRTCSMPLTSYKNLEAEVRGLHEWEKSQDTSTLR